MKNNIVPYLRNYGHYTFSEMPFGPVDALSLSILSYLKMDGIVSGFGKNEGIPFHKILSHPNFEHLFWDPVYGSSYRKIFTIMAKSARYRNIRANYYVECLSEDQEIQFSAVTFLLGSRNTFISFRGTDETLVGWKEDFNMGYLPQVPSQRMALSYIKKTAAYTKGRLVLGGHSKGGNLAVYAAANCGYDIERRIRRIYNFDGPGFQPIFSQYYSYQSILPKCYKIVPEESIIGMLFQRDSHYHVVKSYKYGIRQHDTLQWKIHDDHFVYTSKLKKRYLYLTHRLNTWIASLSVDQISSFVETLYGLFIATKMHNVYELFRRPFYVWFTTHATFYNLNPDEKKGFRNTLRKFIFQRFAKAL